ncbi:hypothetical protein BDW72DRAFT_172759 [Aspergillus terricola var. indicus]
MNRLALYGALSSLRPAGTPKKYGICLVSRNVSTALRPLTPRSPRVRAIHPQMLRWNSSQEPVPEQNVLEQSTSLKQELKEEVPPPKQEEQKQEDSLRSSVIRDVAASPSGERSSLPLHAREKTVTLPINRLESSSRAFLKWWLRDNCQCDKCIHPNTRQRIVDTFSIPENIGVKDISNGPSQVTVTWSDGHVSSYNHYWLAQGGRRASTSLGKYPLRFRKWMTYNPKHEGNAEELPSVSYSEVMANDAGVLKWLERIYDWGFCLVRDTPINPESTEALLRRIAHIRHTHYGGFWDFTADMSFKDTAYTNEALGAHTDNTYFTDPARLQLFHMLSHTDGDGGATLLVDGFRAARRLYAESKQNLSHLRNIRQPFHASGNDDSVYQPVEQQVVLRAHAQFKHRLYQVRWNNYDRAVKWNWSLEEQEAWYKAAKHFNDIIHREDMEIWTQLQPGTALIFDNWRMLHGRSAFTGKRRMCGGYISNDDFLSRYRVLKFGRDHVLQRLGDLRDYPKNPSCIF